jgi:hypothetical protein
MWYDASVSDSAESLIGKPLVVYIKGERKQIGTITNAKSQGDGLFIAGKIDQPSVLEDGSLFEALHEDQPDA